jgi:hypothetical protein
MVPSRRDVERQGQDSGRQRKSWFERILDAYAACADPTPGLIVMPGLLDREDEVPRHRAEPLPAVDIADAVSVLLGVYGYSDDGHAGGRGSWLAQRPLRKPLASCRRANSACASGTDANGLRHGPPGQGAGGPGRPSRRRGAF